MQKQLCSPSGEGNPFSAVYALRMCDIPVKSHQCIHKGSITDLEGAAKEMWNAYLMINELW